LSLPDDNKDGYCSGFRLKNGAGARSAMHGYQHDGERFRPRSPWRTSGVPGGQALVLCTLALCLALAPLPVRGAESVATVLDEEITREEMAAAGDESAQLAWMHNRVWSRVARHYIEHNGLAATEAELADAMAYHREFDSKDRAQRTRKLEELHQRLAADDLKDGQRAWLEEFRDVLLRLAQRDAERDQEPPPDPGRQAQLLAPWVEMWKMNRALYQQYGGVVALTRFGPDPHGARAALVADYERRGLLRFSDAGLRERLSARLEARPSMVVAPERVDFTPYWKRPIPPSYFPD
jgi:hypothetical protein